MKTRKMENSVGLLALKTESSENVSMKRAFAIDPTGGMSRCASSKRHVSLDDEATDLLRGSNLAFRRVVGTSSLLGCGATRDYSCNVDCGAV